MITDKEFLFKDKIQNKNLISSLVEIKPQESLAWMYVDTSVNITYILGGRCNIIYVKDGFQRRQLNSENRMIALEGGSYFALENLEFDKRLILALSMIYDGEDSIRLASNEQISIIKEKYPNQSGIISMFIPEDSIKI